MLDILLDLLMMLGVLVVIWLIVFVAIVIFLTILAFVQHIKQKRALKKLAKELLKGNKEND